jgi:alkyl sulfatase BDS1-like metallo-beta-lactamase superfamily hydrolase
MPKALLGQILVGDTTFVDQVAAGAITLEGDPNALVELFGCLDQFDRGFAIVTP